MTRSMAMAMATPYRDWPEYDLLLIPYWLTCDFDFDYYTNAILRVQYNIYNNVV